MDGAVDEEKLKKEILLIVKGFVGVNVSSKLDHIVSTLKIVSYSGEIKPQLDRIHVANGTLFLDGRFTDQKEFCLRHHIALWDVIESCTINGSSDSSIRDVKANDIAWLISRSSVHTVFTTGAKAASLYRRYISVPQPCISLPSTSAANAHMRLNDLVKEYTCVRNALETN